MGRQIIFHMLAEDRAAFLSFVQKRDSVVITDFTGNSADVLPADLASARAKDREWLCLWNMNLLQTLKREYIPESNIGPYYRIDSSLPILEFSVPSKANGTANQHSPKAAFMRTPTRTTPISGHGTKPSAGGSGGLLRKTPSTGCQDMLDHLPIAGSRTEGSSCHIFHRL